MIGMTNARGGGGLYLRVVGGTSKPTSPRENTIWINTSAAISGYVLSPTQPETAANGIVWLKIADFGVEINVGKKNGVLLHLTSARLYVGKWSNVEGWVYTSGAWKKFSTEIENLYKDGTFDDIPHVTFAMNGTITYMDSYIKAVTKNGSVSETYVQFGPISLTSFGKIMMRASKISKESSAGADIYFAILVSKSNTAKRADAESITEVFIDNKDVDEHIISLDVSNLTGDGWYICVGINTAGNRWNNSREVNIYEVTAE